MAAEFTRADSIREWLSGAASDGGAQADPLLSLGGFRSSTEASTYSVLDTPGLTGVSIVHASGVAQEGDGILWAVDANTLRWKPPGSLAYGPPAIVSGTGVVAVAEGPDDSGSCLRVMATTPLTPGTTAVSLRYKNGGFFSMPDLSVADRLAGIDHYRASVVKNGSGSTVYGFQRCIGTLGPSRLTNSSQLGATGPGTIGSTGSFALWPDSGWAQIRTSGGVHRETVYYASRTGSTLNVTVRGRLGTTEAAGASSDTAYPVPGIAVAIDPTGVQAAGTGFQTVADALTAPAGVTWNQGITPATGLQVGDIPAGQEAGLWIWREIPAGATPEPASLVSVLDTYSAY